MKKEIKKGENKPKIKKTNINKSNTSKTIYKKVDTKKVIQKKEVWYKWIKNNIIENEKNISKEAKNRRLIISLFAIFCFFVVLLSTSIIDYSMATKKNTRPFFVIELKDNFKQTTIYYGMFYKAWKCDNGDDIVHFGRFNSELSYCVLEPKFNKDGIYKNPHGVEITKSQMNIIKNYYFDDFVNIKNKKELENAYKISKALNDVWWVSTKSEKTLNEDSSISIAIFGKTEKKDGIESWSLQYSDKTYHKCMKQLDNKYVFSEYLPNNNTCSNNWKSLSLDKEICELSKNNTKFVSELVIISKLCE